MSLNRFLTCFACLAAAASVLCACGSSSSSSPARPASSCKYTSDSVIAEQPSVGVEPPGSNVTHSVSKGKHESLACNTTVTVAQSGTAQAEFGSQGQLCQLEQYNGQPASLKSRFPPGYILTLNAGQLTCSFNGPFSLPPGAVRCPDGSVIAKRGDQFYAICAPGNVFVVAVYLGSVQVIDSKGRSHLVPKGSELYFASGAFKKKQASFSQDEKSVFAAQALEAGLSVA
jgi:hypothetical protein